MAKARGIDPHNAHSREMDEALAKAEPVIVWRKNNHGVMVHVSIDDPHAEGGSAADRERRQYAYAVALDGQRAAMELEAHEVADRFEKHRADNTPLMNAARSQL